MSVYLFDMGMMGDWAGGMMGWWGWPSMFLLTGATLFLAVVAAVFWLWMFVDCLTRHDKDFPSKGAYDKLVWVIVLLFTNILGALLYFLIVRRMGK